MVRGNYESSVASLLSQIEANRDRLDTARLGDVATEQRTQVGQTSELNFYDLARDALDGVHASQQESKVLKEAFDSGEDVPLTNVVLAMQKSSLAFEATLQVRNKVLKAYEDILNMPV
ncbi:MAG: flagellar hook-basal body complex protein FliE [Candidatus Azotimanducaceae bacterium]|uniref:Flagellar hook-basal body complex protein FliE n=1 Tax=OM182 bacterium TaxID=2510334 RepID=A0A520RZJ0_9GAMM|nr:flagellar hook-basal body complex protein FliE [Gammaproteobacteria bacterium]RZO75584.1 MAG: flagellar hook-basal body complex protein FliE [OM182 bacterium]